MVQTFTANAKFDAYTYDASSQTYTELNYSLPVNTTTSKMNAVGINPLDGTAYGVLGPTGASATNASYLVRWDSAGHMGYIARVPEFSAGGDFDHHGNFIMIADEVRSQPVGRMYLWAISHLDQLKAYAEPTADGVADLTGEDASSPVEWAGTSAAYGYLSESGLTVNPASATPIATAPHAATSVDQTYGQYDLFTGQEHSVYPGFDLVAVKADFEGDG
jgi:hypothetical protein